MHASPARHTIDIYQVSQILQGARVRGYDIEEILRRARIAPALLQSPASRVTLAQYGTLLLVLRRTMRDEFWGLCSRPVPMGSFAHCCRTVLRASNLGDAITSGFAFYRLALSDFSPHLRVTDAQAHISLPPRVALTGELHYALRSFTFLSFGLMSWLIGRRINLTAVRFMDAETRSGRDTVRLFRAPLTYDARFAGFSFEARWLDLPIVRNPKSLQEFLRQAPGNLVVNYRVHSRVSERAQALLRSRLHAELPSLAEIAGELGVSAQTLNRRLREEGYTFQALKNDLRRDAAIDYLARTDLPLVEIASRLGFSEASTFHRAFKAWTGVAPGEYRRHPTPHVRTGQS